MYICLPFTDIQYDACVFITWQLADDGYSRRKKHAGMQKTKLWAVVRSKTSVCKNTASSTTDETITIVHVCHPLCSSSKFLRIKTVSAQRFNAQTKEELQRSRVHITTTGVYAAEFDGGSTTRD
jgi:hypothetical protein